MVFSSSAGVDSRPFDAGQPARREPSPWRGRPPRAVRLAAALAGLAAIGAYLFVAVRRLDYPFALEWLEGNSLVEVRRVLAGQPLYVAPSAGYVPDGYPPLYFLVSAAVARVAGLSYPALRLVSLVSSLACFALLGRLVQRETGSSAAGTAAAGMFAATYFAAATWFDVGRVDSLFLALSTGALYAVRRMRGPRGALIAGLLLAAAALTKQTGAAEAVAVTAALLTGPRRRLACVTAVTELAVVGISTVVLALTSGGWYLYYVFALMGEHSLAYGNFGWFWTALLTAAGLPAGAALIGARRVPRELLAGCAALAVEGCAALVHSGGGINDMLPAYLAVALLAGLAAGGSRRGWPATLPGALVFTQLVFLLASGHPSHAVPTAADRAVGERLTTGLRALGGDVAIPADPGLSLLAGMAPTAHQDAAYDVLRGTNQAAIASFQDSTAAAVTARRFSAIVTDGPGPPLGYPSWLSRYYRLCPQPLLAGTPAALFRPVAGISARPAALWLPVGGSVSCQDAVDILGGTGKRNHP